MFTWNRHRSGLRGSLITALDIGSSKVCCLIAQLQGGTSFKIIGVGHQLSSGIKAGVITNMEEVITSIVNAVHTAEKMAGVTIQDVIISINGAYLKSIHFAVDMNVSGHPIDDADIRRALFQARAAKGDPTFQALHTLPIGYTLDGSKGIKDPRGMYGSRLRVLIHTLLSKSNALHNLTTCVARSHLGIAGTVASPYASGLACLVEDERELGAVLIDMGGSTTSFAVFHEGQLRYADCIPIGGSHVTMDIAHCFSTPLMHAERLKTLYGSATASVADDREMIMVPLVGENRGEGINQMPRSALVSVIKPRIEEIFEQVRDRLLKTKAGSFLGNRVVLTGGGSQLAGVREIASLILGKNVRLGKPLTHSSVGVPQDPSFATCIGLLSYGQMEHRVYLNTLPQSPSKRIFKSLRTVLKEVW
jgi:cell division protein FtsA